MGRPDPTSTPLDPASTPLPELKGEERRRSPAPGSSGEGEEEPGSVLPTTGSGFPAAGSGLLARIA